MKKLKSNALEQYNQFTEKHPKAKKVIKGFGYLFSEKLLKFAIGFLVHTLVARYLGPEKFGKLSYITKTVGVFYTFSAFGVDELVVQYLMDKRHEREDVLRTVITLRLIMSFVAFFLLGIFLYFARPEGIAFSLLIFAYGIQIFIQAFNLYELDFQAQLKFKPLFWANNVSNFFAAGLRLLGIFIKQDVPYFISTYLAGDILLKLIIQWRVGFKIFKGRFDKDIAVSIFRTSFPFFLAAFVVLFDQRISFMFIEELLSDEALGNYSVAVTLVDLWIFLPAAVCAALLPTIVSVFSSNRDAYELRIQYLSDIMVWMSLSFAMGVLFTADLVVNLLYGQKYSSAPEIIRWYSLVTLPIFFNLARIKWMSLENQLVDWLKICSVALIMNIFLHKYLVPIQGVKGAIWSYLLAQIGANIVGVICLKSSRKTAKIFVRTLSFPIRMLQKIR
jgi:O-antigen/teichoic acid export membrane protein